MMLHSKGTPQRKLGTIQYDIVLVTFMVYIQENYFYDSTKYFGIVILKIISYLLVGNSL